MDLMEDHENYGSKKIHCNIYKKINLKRGRKKDFALPSFSLAFLHIYKNLNSYFCAKTRIKMTN